MRARSCEDGGSGFRGGERGGNGQDGSEARQGEDGYVERRNEIFHYVAAAADTPIPTRFGDFRGAAGYFLALLHLNQFEKAGALIRKSVQDVYRDLHKQNGMSLGGDVSDFRVAGLLRAYLRYREDACSVDWEEVRKVCLDFEYPRGGMSENHNILFATSEFLSAQTWMDGVFKDGRTPSEHLDGALEYIWSWIDDRLQGFEEWDSDAYYGMDLAALYNVHDFAEDRTLRRAAEMTIDLILADVVVDSFEGNHCSASGRTYSEQRQNMALSHARSLQYLLFGTGETHVGKNCMSALFQGTSGYRPPACIVDIAVDQSQDYVNREIHRFRGRSRRDLLLGPRSGAVSLVAQAHYTMRTADYMLSCAQLVGGRQGYTEQIWQATLGERAVIFSNHPGDYDVDSRPGYWQGNGFVPQSFQNRNALMCIYNIPTNHPLPFIHIWLPRHEFDEVVDEDQWIFVRRRSSYIGVRTMEPHYWVEYGVWADREVRSFGVRNALVCEAGSAKQHGGFKDFMEALKGNTLSWSPDRLLFLYDSEGAGRMELTWEGIAEVDRTIVDVSAYRRMDSPFTEQMEDMLYRISKNGNEVVLDFRDLRSPRKSVRGR